MVMIIFSLAGILGLVIGGLLLTSPDILYGINEQLLHLTYKIFDYSNKILLRFGKYLNTTCISSKGNFECRMVIAGVSIFIGFCMIYNAYYYSEHDALPPIIDHLLAEIRVHLRTP